VWRADGVPKIEISEAIKIPDLEKFLQKNNPLPDGYAANIIQYVHEARKRVEGK
jgi:hypothetical protein